MGLLDGRKALIFGVANDHSIAWGIAKAFHGQGATVGFSSAEMLIEKRVKVVGVFPRSTHAPIKYPAAVPVGGRQAGGAFLDFLVSPAGQTVFTRYGFTRANTP